ncbi:hypothetical protein B1H29_00070 [Streptomyces pactum]|uniref:Uncharacterized protein n=1 Tax=Streptomyces pactum TaxID=68249 RepID=A0A1S6J1D9_9ACTN|nr:hypothetical protein B1H29_00070 [Streptomyces pactum]
MVDGVLGVGWAEGRQCHHRDLSRLRPQVAQTSFQVFWPPGGTAGYPQPEPAPFLRRQGAELGQQHLVEGWDVAQALIQAVQQHMMCSVALGVQTVVKVCTRGRCVIHVLPQIDQRRRGCIIEQAGEFLLERY